MSSVFFINGQEYSGLLKFGHITGEQPEIIYRKYDKFLTILSKELKCKVILIQAPSYSDMQKAFITKEVTEEQFKKDYLSNPTAPFEHCPDCHTRTGGGRCGACKDGSAWER